LSSEIYARAAAVIEAEIHKLQKKNLIIYFICTFEESSLWQQHPYLFPCYPRQLWAKLLHVRMPSAKWKKFPFLTSTGNFPVSLRLPCVSRFPAFDAHQGAQIKKIIMHRT